MTNKLYLVDSYLREINTTLISCKKVEDKYHVILKDTIFYPDNVGGQPGDKGTINGINIIKSFVDGDDIVHLTNQEVLDKDINMKIDWNHRFDIMQQHTGEHILNSCFKKLLNSKTISVHLSDKYSSVDVGIQAISSEALSNVESLCNTIIHSNFDIRTLFPTDDELKVMKLREQPSVDESIRIIDMNGIDVTPCGGTHLSTTGEVGLIKIIKTEKHKGNLRFTFLCGLRAIKDYDLKNKSFNTITSLLSSSDEKLVASVEKMLEKSKELEDGYRRTKSLLLEYISKDFIINAQKIGGINYIIKEIDTISFKDLSRLSAIINNKIPAVQIYHIKNSTIAQIYITVSDELNVDLIEIMNEVRNVTTFNGGGNKKMIQGTTPMDKLDSTIGAFRDYIRDSIIKVF
ncbi:MAG: hypothetical protein GXZ08_06575 [Tissierellia bacterium]|nr:hypothetical protein [Tissierellia bacterium]